MAYDVAKLKTDIASILHGTTLNSIENIDQLIFRAASEILIDVDPQETKRILPLATTIFSNIFDYALPVDVKGNAIIDIRPQFGRNPWNNAVQTYNKTFDLTKLFNLQDQFTINFNTAIKTLRLSVPQLLPPVVLNAADTLTGNGTWVTGGTASNLTINNINFASGSASLQFDLAAGPPGSQGYLECTNMNAIDLTNQIDQATEFWLSYLPTASNFSGVELRWGSSPTDYYARTVGSTFFGTSFQNGWNQLGGNWLGSNVVGSPDPSSITYLRVTWTYDGSPQTAVLLDNILSSMGTILEIEYYSKYLFRSVITGAFQEEVTRDDDLINLDTETYMLLLNKCAQLATQQNSGNDGAFDLQFFTGQYMKSLQKYKQRYKSEITKPQDTYYQVLGSANYRRWYNGRWW